MAPGSNGAGFETFYRDHIRQRATGAGVGGGVSAKLDLEVVGAEGDIDDTGGASGASAELARAGQGAVMSQAPALAQATRAGVFAPGDGDGADGSSW